MILQTTKSRTTTNSCKWIRGLILAYFIFVAGLWLFLYQGGDRWWPATLILFGPRWLFSLPLLILVPLAAWFERRQLIVLSVAAALLFIPFMGLCIHWNVASSQSPTIRMLTCNVGGHGTDAEKLRRLIQRSNADIVALQECASKMEASFPEGWRFIREADFIVASHYPVTLSAIHKSIEPRHRWPGYLLQCQLQTPIGNVSVSSIHLPSPHPALSSLLDRRTILNLSNLKNLNSEKELRRTASREISRFFQTESNPMIIAGDFNTPVESVFYRRYWSEYSNAFSTAGFGYGLTMQAVIRKYEYGIRIDHILMSGPLAAEKCWVGPDIGSDHLPVIADIRRFQR